MSRVWAHDSLKSKEEALWQKKKCFSPLSWSDLLSKCWSALTCSWSAVQSWNSTLEWGLAGSKNQQEDKETGTGPQTDLTICSLHNLANAEMRSACTFFPHEAHVFSGGCYLLMHSAETTGMKRKLALGWCWLLRGLCIYIFTFANIFSCLVNLQPV